MHVNNNNKNTQTYQLALHRTTYSSWKTKVASKICSYSFEPFLNRMLHHIVFTFRVCVLQYCATLKVLLSSTRILDCTAQFTDWCFWFEYIVEKSISSIAHRFEQKLFSPDSRAVCIFRVLPSFLVESIL